MGAAGLIEIKRRINSIESTRKITKAMGLVATSKLRKVRKTLVVNNNYSMLTQEIMEEVVSALPYEYESIYINNNKNAEKLYIVLTSDTGLCGGFNNNVAAYLNEILPKEERSSKIIVVGKKGITYLKKYGFTIEDKIVDVPDIPTDEEINKIHNLISRLYEDGKVSEVNIVYTEFKSPIKQDPKVEKILPINIQEDKISNYVIEPDIDTVFKSALDIYLKSKIMKCLINSKVSEQSARRNAMDGATENADDILQGLNTKFNRIRQAMITQEISEIIGGAEAQR